MKKIIMLTSAVFVLAGCGTRGSLKTDDSRKPSHAEKLLERQNQRN